MLRDDEEWRSRRQADWEWVLSWVTSLGEEKDRLADLQASLRQTKKESDCQLLIAAKDDYARELEVVEKEKRDCQVRQLSLTPSTVVNKDFSGTLCDAEVVYT